MIRRWIVSTTVAASALSACGTTAYEVHQLGPVRAWVIASAEGGGEALVSGTARWLPQDRCWVLELVSDGPSMDATARRQAIVWPRGTHVSAEQPATVRVGTVSVADGTEISGVGGGSDTIPAGLDIPAACRPAGVVVLSELAG